MSLNCLGVMFTSESKKSEYLTRKDWFRFCWKFMHFIDDPTTLLISVRARSCFFVIDNKLFSATATARNQKHSLLENTMEYNLQDWCLTSRWASVSNLCCVYKIMGKRGSHIAKLISICITPPSLTACTMAHHVRPLTGCPQITPFSGGNAKH